MTARETNADLDKEAMSFDVAVVGMACKAPGAPDLDSLWQLLCQGKEGLVRCDSGMMAGSSADEKRVRDPHFVPVKSTLPDAEEFDAAYFAVNPREAALLDPQHRVFLQCAVHALENAACDADRFDGRIGVYAACGVSTYLLNRISRPVDLVTLDGLELFINNDKDFLPARVAYKLNLRGPAMAVQSGCSSGLLAVHLASQALISGDCDVALAGGVSIHYGEGDGYLWTPGAMFSPDGHCRAFDSEGRGTAFSDGVGVVALKRLEDAIQDGNVIYAVLKASAVNNDGSNKVGFTAPSVSGQTEVIATAQRLAGFSPDSIGFIEGHGTATELGDPIELEALRDVFGSARSTSPCLLGSIKTNIGHVGPAAGIFGFIKTALSLFHRKIPASLHFRKLNPKVEEGGLPFVVNTQLRDWPHDLRPRRAGVSSFGVGGTNVHLCLEEWIDPLTVASGPHDTLIIPISAHSLEALHKMVASVIAMLEQGVDPQRLAYSFQVGRKAYKYRCALIGPDVDRLLKSKDSIQPQASESGSPRVVLVAHANSRSFNGLLDSVESFIPLREELSRCEGDVSQPSGKIQRLRTALNKVGIDRVTVAAVGPHNPFAPSADICGESLDSVSIQSRSQQGASIVVNFGSADPTAAQGHSDDLLASVATGEPCQESVNALPRLLAHLWCSGATVDWRALWASDSKPRLIPLPSYPFQGERFFVEQGKDAPAVSVGGKPVATELAIYGNTWRRIDAQGVKKQVLRGRYAIVGASDHHVSIIRKVLEAKGLEVVSFVCEPTVPTGRSSSGASGYGSPDAAREEDLRRFFDVARSQMGAIDCVVDCRAWSTQEIPNYSQANDLLMLGKVLGRYHANSLTLFVVGVGALDIMGNDPLVPSVSALTGCSLVMSQEYPHIQTRFLDAAPDVFNSGLAQSGAAAILTDWEGAGVSSFVGCRGNTVWRNELERLTIDPHADGLKPHGVYVVTGGLGSLGRGLTLHLLEKYRARVYVLSRREPPFDGSSYRKEGTYSPSEREFFEKVEKLRAFGGLLEYEQCDVSSEASVTRFLSRLRSEGVQVDAIFHLAGLAKDEDFASIARTDRDLIERHLVAKGRSAEVLRAVVPAFSIPQVMLFSSLASTIGGTTLYAYAAANSHLNAVARQGSRDGSAQWISVEWDVWAADSGSQVPNSLRAYAISLEEGFRTVAALLGSPSAYHVCVTKRPMFEEMPMWSDVAVESTTNDGRAGDVDCSDEGPHDSIEETVRGVMADLLGISDIALDDNFFERGGDSLLAVQVAKLLTKKIGIRVLPAIVFDAPSPSLLGEFISREVTTQNKKKSD